MSIEEQKTDASNVVEQPKQGSEEVKLATEQPKDAKKIAVDIGAGVTVELDIEQGKKYIQYRDSRTKSYKEIESKLKSAEEAVKAEATRAQLMEAIKNQNVEQIEEQVASKYKDTIAKFEKKVYSETIKATLSKLGVIGEGLEDATKLVLSDAKPELDGDDIKLNGVKAEDYLKDWTSKKPHLVVSKGATPTGAKQGPQTKVAPKAPVNPFTSLTKGLKKLGEQTK